MFYLYSCYCNNIMPPQKIIPKLLLTVSVSKPYLSAYTTTVGADGKVPYINPSILQEPLLFLSTSRLVITSRAIRGSNSLQIFKRKSMCANT